MDFIDFMLKILNSFNSKYSNRKRLSAEATKAELYEIAGAFAKLASTPNGPGAAEVYEEVESTLGKETQLLLVRLAV